ncbi:hypothetical protein [Maribacter halichondriae]|uniref:hypothetical protein n=1 Tax=Maribacter halichondriae TaxID=2980554 RepID=UPI002358D925|nr:hypothetical protein [Maribacter sp. Hal144]
MKTVSAPILTIIVFLIFTSCSKENISPTQEGSDWIIETNNTITTSMTVGNLTVKGNSILTIDYTSSPDNTLIVKGNLVVEDDAQLIILGNKDLMNDEFIIANDYSSQFNIITKGNSILRIENINMRTQTGTAAENGSIYMSYDAMDNSSMIIDGAKLDNESSWLLGNFRNQSKLVVTNSVYIPTEIYLNDSCSVTINGAETKTGLWMSLTTGSHNIQLPNVGTETWFWNAGSNLGAGVHWSLSVVNSNPGLGVQLFPEATATIAGHGVSPGELTIGYFVSSNNETIDDLQIGLQNGEIIPGRLTLNNVNLGPIAWQIYSVTSSSLTINNSIINEIGIVGDGMVTINNSLLQFAVLACYGQNSSLTINNSEVWNQSIEADNNGLITLGNCNVYGSHFITKQGQSKITIEGGAFHDNPPIDPNTIFVDVATGQANYNPFSAPGPPKKSGTGVITCEAVSNCTW